MSRIGKKTISIPTGVNVTLDGNVIKVKGPKGQLELKYNPIVTVTVEDNEIKVTRPSDEKFHRSLHGTTRSLIENLVIGVTEEFSKVLEIHGVGFRAQLKGNTLAVNAGYSHIVEMPIPDGIKVEVPTPTEIKITGSDKQLVGQFAAEIREIRKPEPYKGKGIRYRGEFVRRKEGKKA